MAKKVTEKYISTGIFTEMNRQSKDTIVKKSKSFKQIHFLKDIKTRVGIEDDVPMGLGFQGGIDDPAFPG